jgi:copper chaperone CopZ
MLCEGCASSVTEALEATGAVSGVEVDLESKLVTVSVPCESQMDGLAAMPKLVDAVKGAGFDAEPEF